MRNNQNTMRYGRQMHSNNGRRNMPGNMNDGCCNPADNNNNRRNAADNNACRSMPANNNNSCRNMPSGNNRMADSRRPAPKPGNDCGRFGQESGCHPPEPCNNDCNPRVRSSMEERRGMEERPCECETPRHKNCGCHFDPLEDFALAMAYVPWQRWQNLFEPCKALQCGTIFEDLSKPFYGKGGCNR